MNSPPFVRFHESDCMDGWECVVYEAQEPGEVPRVSEFFRVTYESVMNGMLDVWLDCITRDYGDNVVFGGFLRTHVEYP